MFIAAKADQARFHQDYGEQVGQIDFFPLMLSLFFRSC
jgi:hypothetical protein